MQIKQFKEVEWAKNHSAELKHVYVNGQFLVQEYHEEHAIRLTICSVKRKGTTWRDGISWDSLQEIKSKIGYGNHCAVEVFPEDKNIVNVSNMRHLFILKERPLVAWIK